ncbi:tRNA (adenosine(37)-N6)-threonylcarbamoyltransferase complex transferase subunit TsaD [Acholeplasma manati]|uniref:tRNA N6-adenosine threonylcarbamoyltransferase n=2 Tax=Paracholeplasma manati TaxID=591373 RepID=A0ABT2Y3S3_9MOLU|nr:tRNA (adenosine(37)-N6)-threonylcarbamoyltransferase complex transferase subunit TsaD [Paracholeplasma manati]MCV2231384.1 tRNA (adenosine(37)-N6)-threonylcarbamoyltransferase complex transferase subunit TsaD [Paracholeplasma manati]MDG0888465.1 tRNA (adenosine(37)-N6)-threonylcarbamoyltransferase complex transferase subunit TsaD [Paracholeplasma manati]
MMLILAVESSCDESSVSIVKDGKTVLSNVVLSQIDIHKVYGGVVPEIASRHHIENMTIVFEEALKQAKVTPQDIDVVAVTEGPGLIGSLLVGINAASAFAFAHNKPLLGVNHMIGHIYSANIENEMKFPLIALVVSGGHTELVYMKEHMSFELLGETQDDAVGEAYDKVGRMLGLAYPGGPIIDKLAQVGKPSYVLPRPMIDEDSYDFSFSGLKSAVNNMIYHMKRKEEVVNVEDMCTSFQASVVDVLVSKLKKAATDFDVKQVLICGGVAANKGLRNRVFETLKDKEIIIPSMQYCTDNAAMIGAAAYYTYQQKGPLKDYILGGQSSLDY